MPIKTICSRGFALPGASRGAARKGQCDPARQPQMANENKSWKSSSGVRN